MNNTKLLITPKNIPKNVTKYEGCINLNKSKTQLLINSKNDKRECCINLIYYDCMLLPIITPNYIIPYKEKYLKVDNFLSEYNDLQSLIRVKKNLGINEIVWGNIQGDLINLKDLYDYIKRINTPEINLDEYLQDLNNRINNKVSIEINDQTESSKLIKYEILNDDIILNNDFNKAVTNVLSGKSPESIDDIIRIMMYKIFPIEYKKWSISSTGDIFKPYSFEKGTTLIIPSDDIIGTITITATPGNLKDTATLIFNNELVKSNLSNTFTFSKTITSGDVLGSNLLYTSSTTKNKTYNYELITSSNNNPNPENDIVELKISTILYYYFLSSENIPTASLFSGSDILNNKSTEKMGNYNLGSNKRYLYVLSPKQIKQVETAAGTSESSANLFMVTTGWDQKPVTYTPIGGGTNQSYYLMWLKDPQSNYVKIKVTI